MSVDHGSVNSSDGLGYPSNLIPAAADQYQIGAVSHLVRSSLERWSAVDPNDRPDPIRE